MKIAVMTQPLGKNYGGMMQAFALQKAIEGLGHEVVTIDRQAPSAGTIRILARRCYRIVKCIIGKRNAPIDIERSFPFIFKNGYDFIARRIVISDCITSTIDLKTHFNDNSYDAVVVGSDQAWRPIYSPDIYNFYLDFLVGSKIKKIAYATSFGVDYWEYSDIETDRCNALSQQFDAISVRENSGVELCKKYLEVDSLCVLDPTMLHEKSFYLDLIGKERILDDCDGIYTYFLDPNVEKFNFSQRLAEKLLGNLFDCQAKCGPSSTAGMRIEDYIMPPVEDWLAGFANSKFVLTDSFHGMVFAIIFNKPFYCIVNHDRGSARFKSLIDLLGLEDRLVDLNIVDFDTLDFDTLDIENYREKLQILKESSMVFLRNNLGLM